MLFDTRYLWAVLTSKDQERTRRLRTLFEKTRAAFVSPVTIYEVYKLSLASGGKDVAKLRTSTISGEFAVVNVDESIAEAGAEISHRLSVPMADALIMATSRQLGVSCVTDDPHFTEVRRVWA